MKKIIALLTLAVLVTECKTAKSGTSKKKNAEVTTQSATKEGTYRVVLSFISKGAGPDNKVQESILKYIEKHPKKPAFEAKRWGREGEVDYCLYLKELSADEQKVFVKDIETMITDKSMVLLSENELYVKKGR